MDTGRPETGQPFRFSYHHSNPQGEDLTPAATRLPAVPSVSGKPGPDTRVLAAKLPLGTRQELSDNINIFRAIGLRNLVPTVKLEIIISEETKTLKQKSQYTPS